MNYENFIKEMEVIVEAELSGGEEDMMPDLDSFKMLSILAFADLTFDRRLSIDDLKSCRTLKDLYRRLNEKQ
jgi:acyl carrier protein